MQEDPSCQHAGSLTSAPQPLRANSSEVQPQHAARALPSELYSARSCASLPVTIHLESIYCAQTFGQIPCWVFL